ncbi:MAG: response regulator [Candidatus Saganbacteria bacterium]|nr:response regulator [Candidatus Saganbacteria bacterium]
MAKILVIDDQESMRTITAQMLKDAGHEVTTAADGAEGLKLFEDAPASYKLIVADVNMPKMDGFELLKTVKAKHPELPVVLVTGTNEEIADYVGKEYKAEAVLKKPYILDEALKTIESILKQT